MTFLRKYDIDVRDRIDQLAVARRILRETNLDEIIKEKLSQGMKSKDIGVLSLRRDNEKKFVSETGIETNS